VSGYRNIQRLAESLLRIAGESSRTGDLYGNQTFMKRASKMVGSLKGVDNIYTQHVPLLSDTIEALVKGRLREADYPHVAPSTAVHSGNSGGGRDKPHSDVLLFVVGGTTYEEERAVEQLNARSDMPRILLGGTSVTNSSSFLSDVEAAHQYEPSSTVSY
jgi:vacuolar protein sorting-associated protein 45